MLGDESISPVGLLDDRQMRTVKDLQLGPVDAGRKRLGMRDDWRASIQGTRDHQGGCGDPAEQSAAIPPGDG